MELSGASTCNDHSVVPAQFNCEERVKQTVLFPFRRKGACPQREHFIDNAINVNREKQICENEDAKCPSSPAPP